MAKLAFTQPTLRGERYVRLVPTGRFRRPGETYSIEYTSNFLDWHTFITYKSPSETVVFGDPFATNTPMRFYLALVK